MFYFDPVYLWYVLIPTLVISFGVQIYLRNTNAKWSKVKSSAELNGSQVGRLLFERTSLEAIRLEHIRGSMTDHFDPRANVVRLSDTTYNKTSVSAMAITAHELGHVQQYQTGSASKRAVSWNQR